MAEWPSTLPCPLYEGCQYTPAENVIRSGMDVGTKVRRRFTWVPEEVTFTLRLTTAQVAILQSFVRDTLKDVLPFQWVEFRAGPDSVATYRFRQRPSYTPVGPGWWDASLQLDLLAWPLS